MSTPTETYLKSKPTGISTRLWNRLTWLGAVFVVVGVGTLVWLWPVASTPIDTAHPVMPIELPVAILWCGIWVKAAER